MKSLRTLAILAGIFSIQGCNPQSIAKLAALDCDTDITLNRKEKNACKEGVKLAAQVAKEAGLNTWSSDSQYKAAARRAEKLCDDKYREDSHEQNACYDGLQKFRDNATSE